MSIDLQFVALPARLLKIRLTADTDLPSVLAWLLGELGCVCARTPTGMRYEEFCQRTDVMLGRIRQICQKRNSVDFWKLYSYLCDIPKDGWLVVLPCLPGESVSSDVLKRVPFELQARNLGKSVDEVRMIHASQTKNLYKHYEIIAHHDVSWGRVLVGEPDKNKRRCRFCGRSMADGATFRKKAHAISQALGNNLIFLNDECDDCNGGFVARLESSLTHYFYGLRPMLNITGKQGSLTEGDSSVAISNDGMGHTTITLSAGARYAQIADGGVSRFSFEIAGGAYVPIDVYRILAKFAMSILPSYNDKDFGKTRNWIRGEPVPNINVGLVARTIDGTQRSNCPELTVYRRKIDSTAVGPKYLCEIFIVGNRFLYFLPVDNGAIMLEDDWIQLFESIPELKKGLEWAFEDMSSVDEAEATSNFVFLTAKQKGCNEDGFEGLVALEENEG